MPSTSSRVASRSAESRLPAWRQRGRGRVSFLLARPYSGSSYGFRSTTPGSRGGAGGMRPRLSPPIRPAPSTPSATPPRVTPPPPPAGGPNIEVVNVPEAKKFFISAAATRKAIFAKLNLNSIIEYIDHLEAFRVANREVVAAFQEKYKSVLEVPEKTDQVPPAADQQQDDHQSADPVAEANAEVKTKLNLIDKKLEVFSLKRFMAKGIDGVSFEMAVEGHAPEQQPPKSTVEVVDLTFRDEITTMANLDEEQRKQMISTATADSSSNTKLETILEEDEEEPSGDFEMTKSMLSILDAQMDEDNDNLKVDVNIGSLNLEPVDGGVQSQEKETLTTSSEKAPALAQDVTEEKKQFRQAAMIEAEEVLSTKTGPTLVEVAPEASPQRLQVTVAAKTRPDGLPGALTWPKPRQEIRDVLIDQLQAKLFQLEQNIKQQQLKMEAVKQVKAPPQVQAPLQAQGPSSVVKSSELQQSLQYGPKLIDFFNDDEEAQLHAVRVNDKCSTRAQLEPQAPPAAAAAPTSAKATLSLGGHQLPLPKDFNRLPSIERNLILAPLPEAIRATYLNLCWEGRFYEQLAMAPLSAREKILLSLSNN